ncbi:MAG: glucosaminidase domain-containing protein, partial [Stellaceae bacterium]
MAVYGETAPTEWGCYDPKPGHPTQSAQDAERRGESPAAGLMAMAALESGFGWTRTALSANNLFGFKYTSAQAADGRGKWILACQPASDP